MEELVKEQSKAQGSSMPDPRSELATFLRRQPDEYQVFGKRTVQIP